MAVLDCESYESSLKSICNLYGTNTVDVVDFLLTVDLDQEYSKETILKDSDDHLTDLFEGRFGKPTQVLDRVCWFHLTKVPLGTDFSEGILPRNLASDKIWSTILSIPSDPRKKSQSSKTKGRWHPQSFLFDENARSNSLGSTCNAGQRDCVPRQCYGQSRLPRTSRDI